MGQATITFPLIQGTVIIDWNDVNLRIGDVTWSIVAAADVRVRIYRVDISPDPVSDIVINGPASDAQPVPGNLRMEEYTDPEYGDTYLRWPEGLVFSVSVLP